MKLPKQAKPVNRTPTPDARGPQPPGSIQPSDFFSDLFGGLNSGLDLALKALPLFL
jgi:hypothetical protein